MLGAAGCYLIALDCGEWSELRNFKLQQNGQTFLTQLTQSGYKDYIGNILTK